MLTTSQNTAKMPAMDKSQAASWPAVVINAEAPKNPTNTAKHCTEVRRQGFWSHPPNPRAIAPRRLLSLVSCTISTPASIDSVNAGSIQYRIPISHLNITFQYRPNSALTSNCHQLATQSRLNQDSLAFRFPDWRLPIAGNHKLAQPYPRRIWGRSWTAAKPILSSSERD